MAQVEQTYQLPPSEILQLADIKPTPQVFLDGIGVNLIIAQRNSMYKTLEEMAEQEFRLGGLRINPANFGRSRVSYYNELKIKNIATGMEYPIKNLPANPMLGNISFSPNSKRLAFYNNTGTKLELYVVDINENPTARKIENIQLNEILGFAYTWVNNDQLLVKAVSDKKGEMASENAVPTGPVVQESSGEKAPNRTYQDLLKNKTDERNFDYFTTVDLVLVDFADGKQKKIVEGKLVRSFDVSPNDQLLLLETVERPYSYVVPYYRFACNISVYNLDGKKVYNVYDVPLTENIPLTSSSVRTGIRDVEWRTDKDATLAWVEALDDGDAAKEAPYRDVVYTLDFPFTGNKTELLKTVNRCNSLIWGNQTTMIVYDSFWKNRNQKTYLVNPSVPNSAKIISDLSFEDSYSSPGGFVSKKNASGNYTLLFSKNNANLYLIGEGYSQEGNKPFVDEFNITTLKTKRLWQADGISTYESIITIFDIEKGLIFNSIESKTMNRNFYVRNIKSKKEPQKITDFKHPYESFKNVYKEKIYYKRADGVDLSATLYLPADYDRKSGKKLPMIMWAYPREFKSATAAGQVTTSPHEFTYLSYGTPIYWAARGYAILDDTDFPIVGEGTTEPNDTFIEQLVANAKAAIDAVEKMGYIDRTKVAVGGHSYGAFMTANLLTHSDLFACGVARSGAYNRTLTPFGFQAEDRTYWEAPEVYFNMSPFSFSQKMKSPLLLIHGQADNNPGTFTLQSERYFQALKGQGTVARLVLLPLESHGYSARSSIMHVLWEQDQWFEKYLKDKK